MLWLFYRNIKIIKNLINVIWQYICFNSDENQKILAFTCSINVSLWERTWLLSDVQWLGCYFITSWYNRKFSILEPDKIRIQRESIHRKKLSCLRCSDLTTGRLKTDGNLWPLARPCQQNNLLQESQVKCSIPHCCWVDHQLSLQVQITLPMNAMRPHKAITGHGHILNQSHV